MSRKEMVTVLRRRIRIDLPFWEFIVWGIVPWLLSGFCLGLLVSNAYPAELPDDPVQRIATKVLRGDCPSEQWQRQGYEKLLRVTPTEYQAWITNYSHTDPGCNRVTASGRKVSQRVAAMIDQPWATWVLIDLPEGYELRQVFDTGSRRNIWRAQNPPRDKHGGLVRLPAETWVDRYLPYRSFDSWVRPIHIF